MTIPRDGSIIPDHQASKSIETSSMSEYKFQLLFLVWALSYFEKAFEHPLKFARNIYFVLWNFYRKTGFVVFFSLVHTSGLDPSLPIASVLYFLFSKIGETERWRSNEGFFP